MKKNAIVGMLLSAAIVITSCAYGDDLKNKEVEQGKGKPTNLSAQVIDNGKDAQSKKSVEQKEEEAPKRPFHFPGHAFSE